MAPTYIRLVLSSIVLILTTACSTTKSPTESPNSLQEKNLPNKINQNSPHQQASALTSWEINGSMAAHHNKKGWTASFNWRQHGADNYQIRLFGPLGGGTVLIDRQNGITTYRDGPEAKSDRNANALLKQKTGVALPVNDLYYWARGIPAPGSSTIIKRDASNHPEVFAQAGYTISYPSATSVQGYHLPKKIRIEGNNVLIKVAIKQWKF